MFNFSEKKKSKYFDILIEFEIQALPGEKFHSVKLHCEWPQNLSHYQTLQNEHPRQQTEQSTKSNINWTSK